MDLAELFSRDARFSHLWSEYAESLHDERELRDGESRILRTRATVPAEAYFSTAVVVDTPLRTEFFKHLPGIFTGVGIIGTFTGLIRGLGAFHVTENAAEVRVGLETLMHYVGEAFIVSAFAITAAMLATFIEKMLLTALYRRTEELAQAIDACFEAGVGEEYLARLVRASEDSASQAKILKDALVRELGELLRELTGAQIASAREQQALLSERIAQAAREQAAAAREDAEALGGVIAGSIRDSLQEPLSAIAETVRAASGEQNSNAARLLEDVMASFSARLNELFGGQIADINHLNRQAAEGMQDAVGALRTMVERLEESGRRSTDEMATRVADAIARMEERQSAMDANAKATVEQVRGLVESMQSQGQRKLEETLEAVGAQMRALVSELGQQGQAASDSLAQRMTEALESMERRQATMDAILREFVTQMRTLLESTQSQSHDRLLATLDALTGRIDALFGRIGEQTGRTTEFVARAGSEFAKTAQDAVTTLATSVDAAAQALETAADQMDRTVVTLAQSTESSAARLDAGSERLGRAAGDFASAGDRVTGVVERVAGVSSAMSETAGALAAGSTTMREIVHDHALARDALRQLVGELRATVDAASREASLTQDILARLESSATRLGAAQQQADQYLQGVTAVLAQAHEAFANGVSRTLDRANQDFHAKLSAAVQMLSADIDELGLALSVAKPNMLAVKR